MDENEVSEPRHGGLRWKLFVLNIYIYFPRLYGSGSTFYAG